MYQLDLSDKVAVIMGVLITREPPIISKAKSEKKITTFLSILSPPLLRLENGRSIDK